CRIAVYRKGNGGARGATEQRDRREVRRMERRVRRHGRDERGGSHHGARLPQADASAAGVRPEVKFAVVGAGAIGGYLGGWLSAAGGDGTFIARGANLD